MVKPRLSKPDHGISDQCLSSSVVATGLAKKLNYYKLQMKSAKPLPEPNTTFNPDVI